MLSKKISQLSLGLLAILFTSGVKADERVAHEPYLFDVYFTSEQDSKFTEKNVEDRVDAILKAVQDKNKKELKKFSRMSLSEKERQIIINYLKSRKAVDIVSESGGGEEAGILAAKEHLKKIEGLRAEFRELLKGRQKGVLKVIQDEVKEKKS